MTFCTLALALLITTNPLYLQVEIESTDNQQKYMVSTLLQQTCHALCKYTLKKLHKLAKMT